MFVLNVGFLPLLLSFNGEKITLTIKERARRIIVRLFERAQRWDPIWVYRSLLLLLGLASAILLGVSAGLEGLPHELSRSFGEALLISFVLAILVDPYIRRRLARDVQSEVFWAIMNTDAPADYRKAFERIVHTSQFHLQTSWFIDFEWEKKETTGVDSSHAVETSESLDHHRVLKLTIRVRINGRNLGPGDFKPEERLWILASCDSYESSYVQWQFEVFGESPQFLELNESQLNQYEDFESDGRVIIDEAAFAGHITVAPGVDYTCDRKGRMFRHGGGYVPLVFDVMSLASSFHFGGPALQDLEARLLFQGTRSDAFGGKPTGQPHVLTFQRATVAGQAGLVTWKTRVSPASPDPRSRSPKVR